MFENLVRVERTNSKRAVMINTGTILNNELVLIKGRDKEKQSNRTNIHKNFCLIT